MASDDYDKPYFIILGLLVLTALGGIYYVVFIAQTWLTRIIVFFGLATVIMFVFMGATFYFAGLANTRGLEETRAKADDAQKTSQV